MIICCKHDKKLAVHYQCEKCKTTYGEKNEARNCCNSDIQIIFWCEKCFDYPEDIEQIKTQKNDNIQD